ncbi:MAG TPA: sugar phosphate nucleotidyltransferase, partial [Microthrixaceae bacterium]|nr:sugar phosphate nucleotidyltransferase [Microthrixaceae bacterium]
TGTSVVALMEVAPEAISSYGCVEVASREGAICEIAGIVEKPKPEDAPSNLGVLGRYLLTADIFDMLDETQPGVGGEIQLTDAIAGLLRKGPVNGYIVSEGRFDIGNKLDYLRATVELALRREDLGGDFRKFLAEVVAREGIA